MPKSKQDKRVKLLPPVRHSDDTPGRKPLWTNRERVLVLASRGVSYLGRHLMKDLVKMLPHAKTDSKLDTKQNFTVINEIAEMKNATKVMFFESRKKLDLYLWISCVPSGPSMKFLLNNIYTTAELKLTGNCMKTSRPLLSFDPVFEANTDNQQNHLLLMREMFVQTFGVPNHHPLSQPFVDKIFSFSQHDDRIWFRNYQIARENSAELAEIGPRFSLQLIKIFSGSFCGSVLYENPKYRSPNEVRSWLKKSKAIKYMNKLGAQKRAEKRKIKDVDYDADPTDEIFRIEEKIIKKS